MGTSLVIPQKQDFGTALAAGDVLLPKIIVRAGERASKRLIEFFTAEIVNENTQRAYGRAAWQFFGWTEDQDLALEDIEPVHVAAWLKGLKRQRGNAEKDLATLSVKQRLAAVRALLDYLVTGGILQFNPSSSVRGPKFKARRGKTPVLDGAEAGKLIRSIPIDTDAGLRDRALIGLMTYTFARVGAATGMKVSDVFVERKRLWIRLHEKGGKQHEMPCHHDLEEYHHGYIEAFGLADDPDGPLFRSINRKTNKLSRRALQQNEAWDMVNRRARAAGISTKICNHTFRGTGITAYLENNGVLERAQAMAAHASTRTTQLYDRRPDRTTLDDVERIRLE